MVGSSLPKEEPMKWPDRRLLDLFGIDHPIIQAPMAGFTPPTMTVAVSEAGGLGSVSAITRFISAAAFSKSCFAM